MQRKLERTCKSTNGNAIERKLETAQERKHEKKRKIESEREEKKRERERQGGGGRKIMKKDE